MNDALLTISRLSRSLLTEVSPQPGCFSYQRHHASLHRFQLPETQPHTAPEVKILPC